MPEVIAKTEFVDARYGSVVRGDKIDVTEPAAKELVDAGLVDRVDHSASPAAKDDKDPPAVKSAPPHPNKMQPPPVNKAKS